LARRSGSTT